MSKFAPNDIIQYSLLSAYNAGLREGGPPVGALGNYGTHGIGMFEEDESDMIKLDAAVFTFDEHGAASKADQEDQLPFVMVTTFHPTQRVKPPKGTSGKKVRDVFADKGGKNTPMSFRITGSFMYISTRQQTFWDVTGTIFGFSIPGWQKNMSGEGLLCCFLSEDGKKGGRVADFETGDGALLQLAKCGRFHLGFPQDEEFEQMRL